MVIKQDNQHSMNQLFECIAEIMAWMSVNFLHLNEQTEIVFF